MKHKHATKQHHADHSKIVTASILALILCGLHAFTILITINNVVFSETLVLALNFIAAIFLASFYGMLAIALLKKKQFALKTGILLAITDIIVSTMLTILDGQALLLTIGTSNFLVEKTFYLVVLLLVVTLSAALSAFIWKAKTQLKH